MSPLVVVCNQCGTEYSFAPGGALSANQSFQFRCTSCGHRFSVNQERLSEEAAEVAPEPAPTTAMLLRQGSDVNRVSGMATLQRWIVQLRVDREDRLSTGDDRWERLGDIPELTQFFEVLDQARASEDPPTESLHGEPPRARRPHRADRVQEEPTEDATVETTVEVSPAEGDAVPDPALLDAGPISPPGELEPDLHEDRFLSDSSFFTEPQAALRAPIDSVEPDDEWQTSGTASNTWIYVGVAVAALLLLLWVEPWASPEPVAPPLPAEQPAPVAAEPPAETPAAVPAEAPVEEPGAEPVEEPGAEPIGEEPAEAPVAEPPAEEPAAVPAEAPEVEPAEQPPVAAVEEPAPALAPAPTPAPAPAAASPQSLVDAGWAAADRGQFSKARDLFTEALAARPNHAGTRFGLGYALEKLGDSETAVTNYCRALASAGSDVSTQREIEGRLRAMNRQCD